MNNIGFDLNEKGLYVGVFDQIQKPASSISNLSLGSEMYWNIAKNYLENSQVDQWLLLNPEDKIVEVPESNIYIISGKTIRGASVDQGAYLDITRPIMIEIFKKLNLEYSEGEAITIKDIRETEEILIVNAIEGIRWILGFEGKRYFNNAIRKISELFNRRD